MNSSTRSTKGFTLSELLIVVAIILVLTAIAIPVFTGSLEKSREATDVANARSAVSLVTSAAMLEGEANDSVKIDGKGTYYTFVALTQQTEGWQTESLANIQNDQEGNAHWVGTPKAGGTAKVTCSADLNVVVYWSGYESATVSEGAKAYEPAINAVLSTIYDDIVAERLSSDKNHIAYVLLKNGKVESVSCYSNKNDANGQAESGLSQEDIDALNTDIAKALESTGYKMNSAGATRVFFDWDGNAIGNDRLNGAPAIGGQGANATLTFTPTSGDNKATTVTNKEGTWGK